MKTNKQIQDEIDNWWGVHNDSVEARTFDGSDRDKELWMCALTASVAIKVLHWVLEEKK